MTRLNKLSALAAVVALSGGLAACGGGSSSTTMMPEPTPQDMCETAGNTWVDGACMTDAQLAAAEATAIADAIADAKTAADALTAMSSDMDVTAAKALIATAQGLIDGAVHATAGETADSDDALDAVSMTVADAEVDIAAHRKAVADAAAAVEAARVAAVTKEAGTKLTQIEAEAMSDGAAGLGGTEATIGTATGNYSLEIEYGSTTVTVHGDTDDDDVEFESMDLGGGLFMNTRDIEATEGADAMPAMQEVAMIMTDIEDDTATAFGMVHTLDLRVDGETATATMPNDALNVVTDNLGHVKAAAFTAPAGTVGTTILSFQQAVEADPGNNVDAADAAEIMGTYEGAMGTYKCNADTACTVTVNGEGVVSAVSGANDWIFIPADGATVDVADTEYLHYGFWLKRSTDAEGVVTYNQVQTFADATGLDASGSTADVEGTASYSGDAVGVYVHHVLSEGGGSVASSTAGHFTADVGLSATFGGDDVTVNDADMLSGTIDNFVLSGGEAQDWSVELEGAEASTTGTHTGTAMGGSGDDGSFTAVFRGDVTAVAGVSPQPSAVVGEFNAGFRNGVAAGAFGATIDDE